jgi:cobyrinic acid a,c-diamide synthase
VVTSIPRVVVAAPASGSGKTTVATGLMAALRARGLTVSPHKVGPDFIDPSYHALATGRPGRSLDAFLCGADLMAPLLLHGSRGADVAVIEGVMGLYDGARGGDVASTAHVARLLEAPVLLVVDAASMSRSVAALVHGFASYDPSVRIAGIVLNKVGSDTHEAMLREHLAPLAIPVVGVVRRADVLAIPSRHLGLVPVAERPADARGTVAALGEVVARTVDLDAVLEIARSAPPLAGDAWDPTDVARPCGPVTIAVAAGAAFSFCYPEHTELLAACGAEVVPFDPLRDETLPDAAAIYLPGGFPETYAAELAANERLRKEVGAFDGPVLAECGGLLYLVRDLGGEPMCGLIDATAQLGGRLHLGYREAVAASDSVLFRRGVDVRAHEFHYTTTDPTVGAQPAWRIGERTEGFVTGRIHASYLHTHWAGAPDIARRLVEALR